MKILYKFWIATLVTMIICSSSLLLGVSAVSGTGEEPTGDANRDSTGQSLSQVVNEYGQIYLSMDALGIFGTNGNLQVQKNSGATVRKAYLMSATTGFTGYQLTPGDIKILNTAVVWDNEIQSSIDSYNYWADVTEIVKPLIDASPPGLVDIGITESSQSLDIDGEILAVIFDDPSQTRNNSIMLYFGSQNIAGDTFNINFGSPIDKDDPNFSIDLSFGISYGYQTTTTTEQFSQINVNEQRLTSSAGGQDDGDNGNGALITVGGIGDQTSNPSDPYSIPTNGDRSDDELYDLRPFVNDGDTSVSIYSENPSNDDNILFAGITLGATRNIAAIDLDISLYKNLPPTEERAIYENIINYFADGVYEASNGAHKLGRVTFHTNGTYVDYADVIWVEKCHPCANVGGIDVEGFHINMCDIFENGGKFSGDYDYLKNENHQRMGGYTLAHEWGHYYYFLYDEYVGDGSRDHILSSPHSDDEAVHHSIMHTPWKAHNLLGDNFHWLNFSISKNFTKKNAQSRVYDASAWDTLVRPQTDDPRDGERNALPIRIYYPELVDVKPLEDDDSPIELPGDARSELNVFWRLDSIITENDPFSRSNTTLEAQLSSIMGNNVSYPEPIILLAFVQNESFVTDMNIDGNILTPSDLTLPVEFSDDGTPPDAEMGDGLYSAIFSPIENGMYSIQVNFDNNNGTAKFVYSSFLPSIGEDGPVPMPEPDPIGENFNLSKTIWVSVSNVVSDDYGNTPSEATSVVADNKPTSGRIDYVNDKDVFVVKTLSEGTTYVRITNLAFGMKPVIRIIAADKTTILFESYLEDSLGEYLYLPLYNLTTDTTVYVEVADTSNQELGCLYDFSVGKQISSDLPKFSIFIPTILR